MTTQSPIHGLAKPSRLPDQLPDDGRARRCTRLDTHAPLLSVRHLPAARPSRVRDEEVAGSNPVTPTTEGLVRAIWLDQETPPDAEYSSRSLTGATPPAGARRDHRATRRLLRELDPLRLHGLTSLPVHVLALPATGRRRDGADYISMRRLSELVGASTPRRLRRPRPAARAASIRPVRTVDLPRQLSITALRDQAPGSARRSGACPRFAAGRAGVGH